MRAKTDSALYRPDLGMVVQEFYEGPMMDFIGLELMPIFPTPLKAGEYPVIPKEVMLSIPDTSRAPRGGYQRGDWEYERGTYDTSENGWEEPMDDTERKMFDEETRGGLSGVISTTRAMKIILRSQEQRISETVFDPVTFSANSVSNEWDDATNATPINDVKDAIAAFRLQCGMLPDVLTISYTTLNDLQVCDQIRSQLQYTYPGIDISNIQAEQLARIFGVPKVLIGKSVYNSAGKGIDATITELWSSEYAALMKISTTGDVVEPGFGFTFLYTGDSPTNAVVEQYREEKIRSDVYRVRHNTSEALLQSKTNAGAVKSNIAASCIYLFDNIHS